MVSPANCTSILCVIRPGGPADSGALTVGLVDGGVAAVGNDKADEAGARGAPVEDGVGADGPHPASPIAMNVPRMMATVLYIGIPRFAW